MGRCVRSSVFFADEGSVVESATKVRMRGDVLCGQLNDKIPARASSQSVSS